MKVGDIVSRISHNYDINFIILKIENNIAYLKGANVRLYADAFVDDLVISKSNQDDYRPVIENEYRDIDEYFYLPGKILHIDGDKYLKEKVA